MNEWMGRIIKCLWHAEPCVSYFTQILNLRYIQLGQGNRLCWFWCAIKQQLEWVLKLTILWNTMISSWVFTVTVVGATNKRSEAIHSFLVCTIANSWLLLLMRLGAAYWMLKTKASLFDFSEAFQFEKVCW